MNASPSDTGNGFDRRGSDTFLGKANKSAFLSTVLGRPVQQLPIFNISVSISWSHKPDQELSLAKKRVVTLVMLGIG